MVTDSESAGALSSAGEGRSRRYAPLVTIPVFAVAALMAKWVIGLGLPFPTCLLRKLTGIPCPTCGCTRSLAAWVNLDFEQAFRFNPLFFLICVGVLVWGAMWILEVIQGRAFFKDLRMGLKYLTRWQLGIVLVAVNWLYLCLKLPK